MLCFIISLDLVFYCTIPIMKFKFKALGGECAREERVEVCHLHHPVQPDQVDHHVRVELCQSLPAHSTRPNKLLLQVCGDCYAEKIRHPRGHCLHYCCSL